MSENHLDATVRGRGPALVLLHGFAGTGRDLDALADALADVRTVISPDLPGHGRTPGLWRDDGRDFERTVARLVATLEAAGHRDADWLGYSMGARLALGCAALRPECVRSLVLIGGRAGIADPDEREARRRSDAELADRIERDGVEAFVDRWLDQPMFTTLRRLGPDAIEKERRKRLGHEPHELAEGLRHLGPGVQPPLFDALPRATAPVLLVAGELDAPFVAHAHDLARQLPRSEVCVIPDAGHAAHVERPTAVLRAVRDFLRRIAPRSDLQTMVQETVQ